MITTAGIDIGLMIATIGLFGALCVAVVTHRFNLRRERNQKRRELVLTYKLEALRELHEGCRKDRNMTQRGPSLERAMFNVQVFGTRRQIELATDFTATFARGELADAAELSNDLRSGVRRELGLEKVDKKLTTLLVTPSQGAVAYSWRGTAT